MALLRFDKISIAYGDKPLLDHTDFTLKPKERVCIVGRNGAGKSTLLNIITDKRTADSGSIWKKPALQISQLEQTADYQQDQTVREFVMSGLQDTLILLDEYQQLSGKTLSEKQLQQLDTLQHELEERKAWEIPARVDALLNRLQLDADTSLKSLSGGWSRRAALAKALIVNPDVLLLDEPTNHLDIPAIEWLESEVLNFRGSVIFITHDRAFLQRIATRIIELDRGKLISFSGRYNDFVTFKEKQLEDEERANALFDKKLAEEETWIRQGIKARRTRNEGRVRALKALRKVRSQRRTQEKTASIRLEDGDTSGDIVIEVKRVSCQYDDQAALINDFSIRIMRGDRIGLIGGNGVGKTTLLKTLLGERKPQRGKIKHGTQLEVAYFDQLRQQLDPEKTIIENVADGREYITINGRDRHIIGYLGDFLFSPERARTPVKALSGGECNRILLARLFSKPANLLVLDEPTNDLDIETLELLENVLCNFKGTLLIVSHDRAFLDNVVTSTLSFEGDGVVKEYVGGYEDWLRQGGKFIGTEAMPAKENKAKRQAVPSQEKQKSTKLSYKLQRELDQLPAKIEALEEELLQLQSEIAAPDFFSKPYDTTKPITEKAETVESQLNEMMTRWENLESLKT